MKLSMEELEHIKKWYAKCEADDYMPENGVTIGRLLDTIEAQRQELDNWKHETKCHMDEVRARNRELEQLRAVLKKVRDVIISAFRENPSQENMEYAEYVLSEIDKVLVGGEEK